MLTCHFPQFSLPYSVERNSRDEPNQPDEPEKPDRPDEPDRAGAAAPGLTEPGLPWR